MKAELFSGIVGYLEGISNIVSFYGVCYAHSYKFIRYDNVNDINECVEKFLDESPIKEHGVRIDSIWKLDDWKNDLFENCCDWFFRVFSMRNFEVSIEDEYGNTMPAQKNKKCNRVFLGLLNRLEEFFGNDELKVYKLFLDPAWVDEFAWEQYFFQSGNEIYVLSLFQEGLV
jgi:hypothetical protein